MEDVNFKESQDGSPYCVLISFFQYIANIVADRIRHTASAISGDHQIPSPPNRTVSKSNAPTSAIILLVREMAVARPAFSMDVKYPPMMILKPANRNDRMKIRNTRTE